MLHQYVLIPLNISTKSLKVNFFFEFPASELDFSLLYIWSRKEVLIKSEVK